MTLYVVGAGMAGLLTANMLRKHNPIVLEAQPSLPNNHSAVLRFATNAVSDVLGIPFRKVTLVKATLPWQNPVADALAYSKKNLGRYESDRSISRGVTTAERWIAPDDLIARMAEDVPIRYGINCDFRGAKVISTIPMPTLMKLLDYHRRDQIKFRYVHGVNAVATISNCDAYVSLNFPDPETPHSRASITGDKLVVEFPNAHPGTRFDLHVRSAAEDLGLDDKDVGDISVVEQKYHKIAAIDERERKEFVHWASAIRGAAWQVGRFATWRPGLQLDDLIKDIRLIERWMTAPNSGYEMERHRGG